MSWTNRLIGFGICTGLAILFIVLVSGNVNTSNGSPYRIHCNSSSNRSP